MVVSRTISYMLLIAVYSMTLVSADHIANPPSNFLSRAWNSFGTRLPDQRIEPKEWNANHEREGNEKPELGSVQLSPASPSHYMKGGRAANEAEYGTPNASLQRSTSPKTFSYSIHGGRSKQRDFATEPFPSKSVINPVKSATPKKVININPPQTSDASSFIDSSETAATKQIFTITTFLALLFLSQ